MPESDRRPTQRAQELRNGATDAERILWRHLSRRQLDGLKFSRQMPVGPFICDFLCRERGLMIELDGGQHAERAAADQRRTAFLQSQGLTVIRFWNNDVLTNINGVLEHILEALGPLPAKFQRAHPQPPPASGRGLI
jgi:very-short-patch-repair endonuclease